MLRPKGPVFLLIWSQTRSITLSPALFSHWTYLYGSENFLDLTILPTFITAIIQYQWCPFLNCRGQIRLLIEVVQNFLLRSRVPSIFSLKFSRKNSRENGWENGNLSRQAPNQTLGRHWRKWRRTVPYVRFLFSLSLGLISP